MYGQCGGIRECTIGQWDTLHGRIGTGLRTLTRGYTPKPCRANRTAFSDVWRWSAIWPGGPHPPRRPCAEGTAPVGSTRRRRRQRTVGEAELLEREHRLARDQVERDRVEPVRPAQRSAAIDSPRL